MPGCPWAILLRSIAHLPSAPLQTSSCDKLLSLPEALLGSGWSSNFQREHDLQMLLLDMPVLDGRRTSFYREFQPSNMSNIWWYDGPIWDNYLIRSWHFHHAQGRCRHVGVPLLHPNLPGRGTRYNGGVAKCGDDMGGSIVMGVPKGMVFVRDNPI